MRYDLRRSSRLRGRSQFRAVLNGRPRRTIGPLTVCAGANDLPYSRLGLTVARQVGTAVRRNRIKRLLREAFRLKQHDWPPGYDMVVIVRAHEPATLADYQRMLETAIRALHEDRIRKAKEPRQQG